MGLGNYNEELTPFYVQRIPDKVSEVACGLTHTLVLTQNGHVYAMGDNRKGQLGTDSTSERGSSLPTNIEVLSYLKMIKIRAGNFSAAMSSDG